MESNGGSQLKLKYLLRGIGIGAILVAAIIHFMYGKSDKVLSDDEIKTKARELGMMTVSEFQDKELNSLKDKLPEISKLKADEKTKTTADKGKDSDTFAKIKNTPSEEGGEAGKPAEEGDNTGKTTDSEKNKTGVSRNGNTQKEPAKTGTAKDENPTINKPETTDTENGAAETGNAQKTDVTTKPAEKSPKVKLTSGKVTFSVTSGMSSETVAVSLKSLGLVDDSREFNKYLVNNDYAARIKIGTFELQKGQSYAEIAAELSK